MRKFVIAVLAAAAFLIGSSGMAGAIEDPFVTCIRECPAPLPDIPRPGPCNGYGFC